MRFDKMARRAHIVFTAANWKWWTYGNGPPAVPSAERIEWTLRDLYDTVKHDSETTFAETGRLAVITEQNEEGVDCEIKVCLVLGTKVL